MKYDHDFEQRLFGELKKEFDNPSVLQEEWLLTDKGFDIRQDYVLGGEYKSLSDDEKDVVIFMSASPDEPLSAKDIGTSLNMPKALSVLEKLKTKGLVRKFF